MGLTFRYQFSRHLLSFKSSQLPGQPASRPEIYGLRLEQVSRLWAAAKSLSLGPALLGWPGVLSRDRAGTQVGQQVRAHLPPYSPGPQGCLHVVWGPQPRCTA